MARLPRPQKGLLATILDRLRHWPPALLASVVFGACLVATLLAWRLTTLNAEAVARAHFDNAATLVADATERRLIGQEQILRGGGALFSLNSAVTREQWHTYVSGLRLDETFPGMLGLGYTLRISRADKDAHIRAVRAEGFPEYTIRPGTPRDEYFSIIYLEPFWGRNVRAFGYDMFTEPVRRSAMERARDSGEVAMSGRVTLVQEGKRDQQYGLLMYLPVYRAGMPRGSVEERRAALLGFVYSPLRAGDLMHSVLASTVTSTLVDIYLGDKPTPEAQLYSHGEQTDMGKFSTVRQVHFGGMPWQLHFTSRASADSAVASSQGAIILIGGLLVSVLLTVIVTNLAVTRNIAYGMARDITQQLSHSESQLRSILDSAADGILSVDGRGVIHSANIAAEHIFGRSPSDLAGTLIEDIIDGLDEQRLAAEIAAGGNAGRKNMSMHFEASGLRASGESFPLSVSMSRFAMDGEYRYSLLVRDITEERMAAAILQLRLQAIESSANGIIITDMSIPGEPTIYANPAFYRMTGYSADEVIGLNSKFLHGPGTGAAEIEQLQAAIEAGTSCQVLMLHYRKDGTPFWNELSISPVRNDAGAVTHYIASQNDVSDRIRAEEKLHERTRRMDTILTLSPDGFIAFDAGGRVAYANPAFLRMTGFQEEDLHRFSETGLDAAMAALCDPSYPYVPLAVGEPATLHLLKPVQRILSRSARSDGDGAAERIFYFRDITHETEVDRIKSEFLSTAAHELRTPMASIFGFSELLLRRQYDDQTRGDLLGTINRQAKVLINLINELLDLARIEARGSMDFVIESHPLGEIIDSTIDSLYVNGDTRAVKLLLPTPLPQVRVDREKFIQALTNVLSNAFKYSPNGGEITLEVLHEQRQDAPWAGIRVRDRGIGMSKESLARLFERFFRADPSGNIAGTGLGMCIVREILELHGGDVEVASELGAGTAVTLWLPLEQQDGKDMPSVDRQSPIAGQHPRTSIMAQVP